MRNWKEYSNSITINGKLYTSEQLLSLNISSFPEWEKLFFNFIFEWLNEEEYITVKTSGSTGSPKSIKISKITFVNSALNTGNYLNLNKKDTALLCLPGNYIAGKMMIVRAFVIGYDLHWQKPSSTPIIDEKYSFSAMTPMQLQNILKSNKTSINKIDKLIIGGAPANKELIDKVSTLDTKIFETYGMTETASHIALKKLNEKSDFFEVLDGINISIDQKHCLTISSKYLNIDDLTTNDLVEIKNKKFFKWLGRIDNVINSGGIKLIPEQIEAKLNSIIDNKFFIFAEKHPLLSQSVALVIESKDSIDLNHLKNILTKYEIPKNIYYLENFAFTDSGKINRRQTIAMLSTNLH